MRRHLVRLAIGSLVLVRTAGVTEAQGNPAPDSYLCYEAAIAAGQPKLPSGSTAMVTDALGGPRAFDVTKSSTLCNPAGVNGGGIAHGAVHEEGFAIRTHGGAPRFVKSDHVTVDRFARRTLTLTKPTSLLDVTPSAPGATPPAAFGSDPTSDPGVNRFTCYKAKLARGSSRFIPPSLPAVVDDFFTGGQRLLARKVTKVCSPADVNGETPGAEARESSLVCYQVTQFPGSPPSSARTVSTDGANFGPHVLGVRKVAELCVPAIIDPPSTDGPPIVAPSSVWTWVDFADSACDDGTATGIGVNLTGSRNVLVYLNGGGACWDYTSCYIQNLAVHGPFGKPQFDAFAGGFGNGTIFDRHLAGNPFADWNFVFLPYCTGDLHGGDNVATYQSGPTVRMYHHVGHSNVLAFLRRLGPTFPTIDRMVVSGASAGGFGAVLNFAVFRDRWPAGKMYLLDDSGPFLETGGIPPALVTAWFANWHLGDVTDPLCGVACRTDLSRLMPALVSGYRADRMALLSSVQDDVVRAYFQLSAAGFQADLLQMAADRLDPTTTFRYFFVAGASHTMVGAPAAFSQDGVTLLDWIGQQVSDDPGWVSVKP